MSDIVLGTATQQNLLSLQNINTQLTTTQEHLATGLKVGSAVDNAVLFFQAQSLTNRATDLDTRKSNIDQGISSLTTATQGIQSAITILQQMQGLVDSAKTETASQRASAATQFNTLANQLNQLLNDTSYQGLNLVNSTSTNLTLQFSTATASTLKISGQNLLMSVLMGGLDHHDKIAWTGSHGGGSGHSVGSGYSSYMAYSGFSKGSGHSSGSNYSAYQKWTGSTALGSNHSAGSGFSLWKLETYTATSFTKGSGHSKGSKYSVDTRVAYSQYLAGSGHSVGSGFTKYAFQVVSTGVQASLQATAFAGVKFSQAVSTGKTSAFDTVYNKLNDAIASAQAAAQSLGANVSLLNTRLSFTSDYITTLQGGANKLTVADLNVESTNLVTLQTRQQLAIQSLSIATQSEQAVLRLFH